MFPWLGAAVAAALNVVAALNVAAAVAVAVAVPVALNVAVATVAVDHDWNIGTIRLTLIPKSNGR